MTKGLKVLTLAIAYGKGWSGTGRIRRVSWTKGTYIVVRHPNLWGKVSLFEAEILTGDEYGWITVPYQITSEDFSATDWVTP